jgi:two-component system chemotaxis response regulator CheY
MRKILIVDDSTVSRKITKTCIPNDGKYEFYDANNGQVGLETFKEIRPDVTFLDLTMPVMDGYQCLEEIKKVDENALVIVVTSDVQVKAISRVYYLGAFKVLKKPVTKKIIQEALTEAEEALEKFE